MVAFQIEDVNNVLYCILRMVMIMNFNMSAEHPFYPEV